MALRQNAISVGAVEYLLKGCGCDPAKERAVDLEKALERDPGMRADHQHEHSRDHGADRYFDRAVDQGEPAGVWLGTGMEALGLAARDGDRAVADEVRAVFGQLRRPGPVGANREADWIGARPRQYPSREEKVAKLLANEPGGTASAERLVELETQVAASPQRSAVAYYDWTFSPVKSVSVYYAALLAAGDEAGAAQVRGAHEQAVREAMAYAEQHVAWTRNGSHGRNADGDRVGEFVRGIGLSAVAFGHSTSRENEPQLHTHVALLNRIGFLLESGELKIGALDSRGFFAMKQAVEAVYTRSLEDQLTEERGVVFATRPDGKAREIAGIGQDLMDEASTRRSQVLERVAELVAAYEARTGHEPAQATRRRLSEMAALETRPAKSEMSGPAGVHAWGAQRVERLVAALERVDDLGVQSALAAAIRDAGTDGRGHQPDGHGQEAGHERGRETDRGLAGLAADLERVATAGEPVAGQAERVAAAMGSTAMLEERVAAAVAAGIADVQAAYPTFVLGTLVAHIDAHLPATAELGIARTERGAYVERLAARAVAAEGGHEVVQLTGHEPVEVPEALLRGADGRPRFRPHMDQRYTTTAHLEREERIVARFAEPAAPVLDEPGLRAAEARMTRVGLSADQRAAALGVLASTRRGSVLIGPAGTGKSRTVMALAHEWAAATGGQVFGVATSQRATMNLESDGLRALNTTAFLGRFAPDPVTGAPARESLGAGDLVVIDEASMSSTDHLAQITRLVAEAGARILPAGDHAQLQSVGAGGMFAVLAEKVAPGQRHELTEVHRFTHDWEKAASLRLRDGDATVFDEYAARGRVRFGTLEEMQDGAARAYVTDRLAGRSSLLIVATNPQAAAVSDIVRQELVDLGRVGAQPVAHLGDDTELGLGDVVLALRNDYRARVDPAPAGPDGRAGEARPVMNKELYTVIGAGPDRTLYVRDARGAVAHLPEGYVREHLTLGYAVTGHGAQGVTVDVGHNLVDRDATRESVYTGGGRGAGENLFWQVTDRAPDAHDPERLHEMSRERWVDALERRAVEPAAIEVQAGYEATAGSLASVAARAQIELAAAARARHEQVLDQLAADGVLDPAQLARLRSPAERSDRERLEHALRGAELGGHDVARVLDRAIRDRELTTADSVGDVLKHRVVVATGRPGPYGSARSWADIVATHTPTAHSPTVPTPAERHLEVASAAGVEPAAGVGPDEAVAARSERLEYDVPFARGTYLASAAALADERQAAIGPRAAEAQAPWAVALLGPVPDRDHAPEQRVEWERAASVIGGARELLAVGDQQVSLGEAPSPERALERHLWHAAMDEVTTAPAGAGRDWRVADTAELYQAREQWARAHEHAPDWVGDELAAAHQLIRDYDGDAVRDAARARRDQNTDPEQAAGYARQADIAAGAAELARERVAELEAAHQARQAWWGENGHREQDARAAAAELARRGLPLERGVTQSTPETPDHALEHQVDEHQVDEHQVDVSVPELAVEPDVAGEAPESVPDWAQRLDDRAAAAEAAAALQRAEQREAERERLEVEAEQQQRAELEARQVEERERAQQEQRALETAPEADLDPDPDPDPEPELQRELQPEVERERSAVVEREQPVVESEAEREARDRRFDADEALQKARAARLSVQQRQQQRDDDEADRHRSRMQHEHHHRQHEREHDRGHEHGY